MMEAAAGENPGPSKGQELEGWVESGVHTCSVK